MSTQYPDPMPNRLKTWTVYLRGNNPSESVQAYAIEYTRNHIVFTTYQGVTYRAYRSEDVKEISLVA
jgi:hypothetical protein